MGSLLMEPDDIASYAEIYRTGNQTLCVSIGKTTFTTSDPLGYSVPFYLLQLSLASLIILFTSRLLKPLGLPSMVPQILGGLILGPSILGKLTSEFVLIVFPYQDLVVVDALAVLGYMFYFFLIGVQMDFWIFKKIEKRDITIGISAVSVAMILSLSAAFILRGGGLVNVEPDISSSLTPVAMPSSVLGFHVISHYLTELKMVNSEFGRRALSSSLVANIFGYFVINFMALLLGLTNDKWLTMQNFISATGFTLVIVFLVRPIILWALRRNIDNPDMQGSKQQQQPLKQGFIFMMILGVLVSGFCCKAIGLGIFFGPLIYGIAIPAGPPLGSAMMEKLELITFWLFMPLYFVKSCIIIDIFSVKPKNYLIVQSVILIACTGKFFGALISSLYVRVPRREAIQLGLVMNVQGVFELGMFKLMKQNKVIHEDPFIVMCISILVVTSTVTLILRYLYDPLRKHARHRKKGLMNLRPDSKLRIVACIHDQENVPAIIDLVEAFHPSKPTPIEMCLLHLVDMVGRAHPILVPHKLDSNYYSNNSTRSIINAFKRLQQSYDGTFLTVHPFTAVSPYGTMHHEVCEMALDRRASLIIIPFHRSYATIGVIESSNVGVRTVNDNILAMAPCTTAIVLDRSAQVVRSSNWQDTEACILYRVAVFFIGGPDDREALAIGARMVGQSNITLTITRIIESNRAAGCNDVATETRFDNEVINEMRSRMAGNQRVVYVEQVVKDGTGTVAVIQSIENEYELIILGRRHDPRSPLILGFSDWGENSELGTVGDMFALPDSSSKSTLLVVQQHSALVCTTK